MDNNVCHKTDTGIVTFYCQGCCSHHAVWVNQPNDLTGAKWNWNYSLDKPTFTPSILVNKGKSNPNAEVCHSFVTDGYIKYLDDCTHKLAGKTVKLLTEEEILLSFNEE